MKTFSVPFETKALKPTGEFSGYGSVFGTVDLAGDQVVKGAFAKSLADWRSKAKLPALLWQHRQSEPIGLWTKMVEDDRGLYVEGRILVEAGELERRAYEHLKAGSVSGLSIGYSIPAGGQHYDSAVKANKLTALALHEISVVTMPANPDAQVDVVKAAIAGGRREVERILRDAGFSKSQARALLADGFAGLQPDAEPEVDLDVVAKQLAELTAKLRA